MGGLLGLLDLGANSLLANSSAITTVGRNTANVNTEGYSRQSIDLESELGSRFGGGVTAGDARRSQDELLARRERRVASDRMNTQDLMAALEDLEHGLAGEGQDVVHSIAGFFAGISALAGAPASDGLRTSAVQAASTTAQSFQRAARSIAEGRAAADGRISTLARRASELTAEIAGANRALSSKDPDPVLLDHRDLAARRLSELVGGQARIDPDGKMRFILDGGAVLVDGDRAASLSARSDAGYGGYFRVDVVDGDHVIDITRQLSGGRIAGQIAFRDGVAAKAETDLDTLAFDFATRVNAVHQAQQGLDGVSGRSLFTQPATARGAAAAIAVNAAIVAQPRQLAVAGAGRGPGDASGVAAMNALRDAAAAGGGTRSFSDEAIRMVGAVGGAVRTARADNTLAIARDNQLKSIRDSVSGVSMQDELARLAQLQHASEASTTFNGTRLLDGSYTAKLFQIGADANQTIGVSLSGARATDIGNNAVASTTAAAGLADAIAPIAGALGATTNGFAAQTLTLAGNLGTATSGALAAGSSAAQIAAAVNLQTANTGVTAAATTTATVSGLSAAGTVSFNLYGTNAAAVSISANVVSNTDLSGLANAINNVTASTGITAVANGASLTLTSATGTNIGIESFTNSGAGTVAVQGAGPTARTLTSGAANSTLVGGSVSFASSNAYTVSTSAGTTFLTAASVGSTLSSVASANIGTQAGANSAITVIDGALGAINSMRGTLGAIQNRFQNAIARLNAVSENVSAARSRIQDADFGKETSALTRAQVLQQAGTAMLAQANSSAQGVLSLLR